MSAAVDGAPPHNVENSYDSIAGRLLANADMLQPT